MYSLNLIEQFCFYIVLQIHTSPYIEQFDPHLRYKILALVQILKSQGVMADKLDIVIMCDASFAIISKYKK